MIEGNRPWWRAVMLAAASLWGCGGTIVHSPPDAAVSDPGASASPPAINGPSTCAAGTTLRAAACVDIATDVAHCGACNHACESDWSCDMGSCVCASGHRRVGALCVADDAPRPLAPVSRAT